MSTPPSFGMSPPPPPPPPPPSSSRRGCFIAIGVVLVLVVIACVVGFFWFKNNAGSMLAVAMEGARAQAVQQIAPDVDPSKRAEFEAEIAAYAAFLRTLDAEGMQAAGPKAVAPMEALKNATSDNSITADEIDRFIELSRAARGATGAAPAPEGTGGEATGPTSP